MCLAQTEPGSLKFVKEARREGDVIRLTPPLKYKAGAAWAKSAVSVNVAFETRFRFRLTEAADNIYGGADGFAFVIQTLGPNALAGRGASGGFSVGRGPNNPSTKGIPRSLAIFFDTFKNEEEQDPSGNSIGLFLNGDGKWLPRRLAIEPGPPIRMKDGKEHLVRITYNRPELKVFLDEIAEPVLRSSIDIGSIVGGDGKAFIGFTAATGEGFQNHDIFDWQFRSELQQVESSVRFNDQQCLPDRTLCTPGQATVETLGARRYRLVVPANLEWPVSVESDGPVRIARASGTVCWNRQARQNDACNGPEGNPNLNRAGLLKESAVAGSLIQEVREGRTIFSINGRKRDFESNEGFFEIEVELLP
jgi:hypothetical protein